MPQPIPSIFIHAALPCEAKPIVAHYKLKKDLGCHPFEVYLNGRICLTVTGIGKAAMAAGVAYTQARAGGIETPAMLNVGIAGHAEYELGRAFIAGKIVDADAGKNYYPPLVFAPPCAAETIRTVAVPHFLYAEPHLYDMEASAFYETAIRFTTGELAQCLKVISDNRAQSAERIHPGLVAEWIAAQLPVLDALTAELAALSESLPSGEPCQLAELLGLCRFSANERQQLRHQLLRWECLTAGERLDLGGFRPQNGRQVLDWLAQRIGALDFIL